MCGTEGRRRDAGPASAGRRRVRPLGIIVAVLVTALAAALGSAPVRAGDSVVRAVLFYSPDCPHCHQVLTVDLPAIQDRYGNRFQLALVDVSGEAGARLYESMVAALDVPSHRIGVPSLVIENTVLVGSFEIPAYLPALIDAGLARGGTDWPAIPGLPEELATPSTAPTDEPATPSPAPAASGIDLSPSAIAERYGRDPLGNTLAIIVLVVLLLSVGRATAGVWAQSGVQPHRQPSAWIGAAALIGLGLATYLAAAELTSSTAVCGPVGDCNAVHASPYSRVLGIPVGVLGVAGYVAILGCWLVSRVSSAAALAGQLSMFLLALGGTIFSAYLTLLEPFVIGATCGWCLGSAVMMGAILYLAPMPNLAATPARGVKRRRTESGGRRDAGGGA